MKPNKKTSLTTLFMMALCLVSDITAKNGLTFRHNHGRLGDVLLNYTKNFYIAQKHGLDLYILNEIPYVHDFMLDLETPHIHVNSPLFNKRISISNDTQITGTHDNALYISGCYITVDGISNFDAWHSHMFQCSIEQPAFGSQIKKHLTPKKPYDMQLPQDITTVAIHIRKGGGFDHPLASEQYRPEHPQEGEGTRTNYKEYVDRDQPFKFPPEQYYVDQLNFLHALLDYQPLYVFVFTDDRDPEAIVDRIKQRINNANIQFDYRKAGNAHDKNILEDISFMSMFDYLIKSGSHYPWVAQMIGNHKAIISPTAYEWQADYLSITESEIAIPDRTNHILHKLPSEYRAIEQIKTLLYIDQ